MNINEFLNYVNKENVIYVIQKCLDIYKLSEVRK